MMNAEHITSCKGVVKEDDNTRNSDLKSFFMQQALQVARDALLIGEVPVGCVIVLRDGSTIEPSTSTVNDGADNEKSNKIECSSTYDTSPSVIISHGANQVNATRDATRHAEMVAIDRMLTLGRASDQMKLSSDVICKSAHGTNIPKSYTSMSEDKKKLDDKWINIPQCKHHWKNTFGWGSGRVYKKDIFKQCDLYVTCEPCIMVRRDTWYAYCVSIILMCIYI
jgi:tRNA(Arg) A34 adenosine deaminase TadA